MIWNPDDDMSEIRTCLDFGHLFYSRLLNPRSIFVSDFILLPKQRVALPWHRNNRLQQLAPTSPDFWILQAGRFPQIFFTCKCHTEIEIQWVSVNRTGSVFRQLGCVRFPVTLWAQVLEIQTPF